MNQNFWRVYPQHNLQKTKLPDLYDSRVVLCEYSTLDDIVTDPFALSKAIVFKLHSRYFVIANQLSEYKNVHHPFLWLILRSMLKILEVLRLFVKYFPNRGSL